MKIFYYPFTDLIFCGSRAFIEKITLLVMAVRPLFSHPLNNKIAVEQPILKLGLPNFRWIFNIFI